MTDPEQEKAARLERIQSLKARAMPLGAFVQSPTQEAEQLLGPFIQRGCRTIIGGYGGHGKSTFCLDMVRAFVTQNRFLGYRGKGGTALIVDLEQGMAVAQRRIYESFIGEKLNPGDRVHDLVRDLELSEKEWHDIIYCDWGEGVSLVSMSADVEAFEELIVENRPDVVLIDPIYKLFLGGDVNGQEAISAFIKEIDKLRTKYGFALVLPMHPRKPPTSPSVPLRMHDLYGNTIWSWWAETVVMLERGQDDGTAVLRFEKDRIGDGEPNGSVWNLTFDRGTGFSRSSTESESRPIATNQKVYEFLQRNPGVRYDRTKLSTSLNISERSIGSALRQIDEDRKEDPNSWPGFIKEKRTNGSKKEFFMFDVQESQAQRVFDFIERQMPNTDPTDFEHF